jgi:hypothetical protein
MDIASLESSAGSRLGSRSSVHLANMIHPMNRRSASCRVEGFENAPARIEELTPVAVASSCNPT